MILVGATLVASTTSSALGGLRGSAHSVMQANKVAHNQGF